MDFGMLIPCPPIIYGKSDFFHRTHTKCGEIAPRDCGQRTRLHGHEAHKSPLNAISPLSKVKLNATYANEEMMFNTTNTSSG